MASLIEGLPESIRVVPDDPAGWAEWRDKALAWRVLTRDRIERDKDARAAALALCADDCAYHAILFGATFEPRDRPGRPKGWWPLVPYEFQIRLIRWIDDVLAANPGTESALMGRGDGVLEKARGMAGSWTFCAYAATKWLHDDGFVAGFMSYKQDVVDQSNSTDTLFYKIEGYLGLDPRVPVSREMEIDGQTVTVPVRSPEWLIPEGYNPRIHNRDLVLAHPTRTNVINGYSTGERTGVGARATMMVLDEAAKFPAFPAVWQSVSATTDHRFALSSADLRFGSGFRDLARVAERAWRDETQGPAFMRLRPEEHPERDELWREEIEARHAGSEEAAEALAREYDLDYDAGHGAFIYPYAKTIEPMALTFRAADEMLDFCIDPGFRDMTALHLVKYDPGKDRYGLLASYANNGLPAEFYASLATASPLHGEYEYGEAEERIMQWFADYGRRIRFWIGDPAGRQANVNTGTSFYDEFKKAAHRLTDGRRPVAIWASDKSEYKQVGPRISALRWLLPKLDINDEPDTRRTLEAIRDHRYKAVDFDRDVTAISALPVRTWGHDRVTALEFYAVHRRLGGAQAESRKRVARAPVYRTTMGGKTIGGRTGNTPSIFQGSVSRWTRKNW